MCDNISEVSATGEATVKPAVNPSSLSPVALAFMGDAVYEALVRNYLITALRVPTAKLHAACVGFVKASAQADAVRKLTPHLTDEEQTIFRRGRNANTTHVPKNAAPADYRYATGFEALFGYLHLCGQKERIQTLFDLIVQAQDEAKA